MENRQPVKLANTVHSIAIRRLCMMAIPIKATCISSVLGADVDDIEVGDLIGTTVGGKI
jgi:hypothetical protein